jgi:aminoglycoside 3-N-acetyltransferase
VAVGENGDELVREHPLMDPLHPIRKMLKYNPYVLIMGVDLDAVTAIHLAEERKTTSKFVSERALTITSKGQVWVEVLGIGCSRGFPKIRTRVPQIDHKETTIGLAKAELYSMRSLLERAEMLLGQDPAGLSCDNNACLSCVRVSRTN